MHTGEKSEDKNPEIWTLNTSRYILGAWFFFFPKQLKDKKLARLCTAGSIGML